MSTRSDRGPGGPVAASGPGGTGPGGLHAAGGLRASLGFPKARRLRKRRGFLRVQQGGVRVSTAHFLFMVGPAPEPGPSRLGITASRQVGNAIVRNRAKRLVREVFRTAGPWVPDGIDLVVSVRAGAEALGRQGVLAEWSRVRTQLGRRAAGLARPAQPARGLRGASPWRGRARRLTFGLVLARLLLFFLELYRRILSPFLGDVCRFSPSCSRYASACIEAHGALRGSLLSVVRVCKCHPFHPGGYDPPPPALTRG